MRRPGWLTAAALVVVANLFVLGGVAWNRYAGPPATLTLTSRELPLAYGSPSLEDSSVALRIDTGHATYRAWDDARPDVLRSWLDARTLARLGFDVPALEAGLYAGAGVKHQPSRAVHVFVAFGGPALEAYQRQLREELASAKAYERQGLERELRLGSRLFVVDADRDPAALAARHPRSEPGVILPAVASAWPVRLADGTVRTHGAFEISVERVNVPRRFHAALAAARAARDRREALRLEPAGEAEYEVVLAVGRRHEPWVVEVRRASTPAP